MLADLYQGPEVPEIINVEETLKILKINRTYNIVCMYNTQRNMLLYIILINIF